MSSDLDVLKDIPGYKAILKSVLKSQIQLLIEQLSQHTGEETVILTASVHDGSLSHLGSMTGKGFLEGREEIKSQFLGYCLKAVNERKVSGIRASPYQRPSLGNTFPQKRQKVQPLGPHRSGSNGSLLGSAIKSTEVPQSQDIGNDNAVFSVNKTNDFSVNLSVVKYEGNEQTRYNYGSSNSSKVNDSSSSGIHLSHTQTSVSEYSEASQSDNHQENGSTGNESETDDSNATSIKIEPIMENEMDLEITGVEPGNGLHTEAWARSQDTDQSGYSIQQKYQPIQLIPYNTDSGEKPLIIYQPVKGYHSMAFISNGRESLGEQGQSNVSSIPTVVQSFEAAMPHFEFPKVLPTCTFNSTNHIDLDTPTGSQFTTASADQGMPSYTPTIQSQAKQEPLLISVQDSSRRLRDDTSLPFTRENYGWEKNKWTLKKYVCQYCGRRCMKTSDLTRHVKIHTGEYSYECPQCQKRFREKFNLTAHYRNGKCKPTHSCDN